MQPDNIGQIANPHGNQGQQQRPLTRQDYILMQELGREVVKVIHKFAIEKKHDVAYETIIGAFGYVTKLHTNRLAKLGSSFIKLEDASQNQNLAIEEPYEQEVKNSPDDQKIILKK